MSFDYLNEAFKKLEFLNEELFDATPQGVNNLDEFKSADDVTDLVRVIDPEAETEEDLQDSYIGKVITNCNVCHSNIFKNKSDIIIGDDGVVNIEEQCPYCGETMGFAVIGEVSEFKPEPEETGEVTVEVDDATVTTDGDDAPTEETIEESLTEAKHYKPHTLKLLKLLNSSDTDEPINESMNNVNVETDDTVVSIESDDAGKVTVSTEPKVAEVVEGEEAIVPVSAETQEEIVADNDIVVDDEATEDDIDFDIDELDEDSFNELGESYLRETYDNVESFTTTQISSDDTKLFIEGVIKFTSGAEKSTKFVFEALSATTDGKITFSGMNEHFSARSGIYTLTGNVSDKKFISESLKYNYRAKSSDDTAHKVSGIVTKK